MARLLGLGGRSAAVALVLGATLLASPSAFAAGKAPPSAPPAGGTSLLSPFSFVDGLAFSPGSRVTSQTVPLSTPDLLGDLLVAWVGQFDATGDVHISDSAGDSWVRVAS